LPKYRAGPFGTLGGSSGRLAGLRTLAQQQQQEPSTPGLVPWNPALMAQIESDRENPARVKNVCQESSSCVTSS
jgi:hypothetical protein